MSGGGWPARVTNQALWDPVAWPFHARDWPAGRTTALRNYDNYTFTHMVNVSILSMAEARGLGIDGPALRAIGMAGLVHDIGKVRTPHQILNKPDRLNDEERVIMRRSVQLLGIYPPGNFVKLNTGVFAVVIRANPGDPYRPKVRVVVDRSGRLLEMPYDINLWEMTPSPDRASSVVAPADASEYGIDPLSCL